jgi:hypothetical protein
LHGEILLCLIVMQTSGKLLDFFEELHIDGTAFFVKLSARPKNSPIFGAWHAE